MVDDALARGAHAVIGVSVDLVEVAEGRGVGRRHRGHSRRASDRQVVAEGEIPVGTGLAGSPRILSPMMFFCTSSVPPPMRSPACPGKRPATRRQRCFRRATGPSSSSPRIARVAEEPGRRQLDHRALGREPALGEEAAAAACGTEEESSMAAKNRSRTCAAVPGAGPDTAP